MSFLRYVPPMGIYETLYSFLEPFESDGANLERALAKL